MLASASSLIRRVPRRDELIKRRDALTTVAEEGSGTAIQIAQQIAKPVQHDCAEPGEKLAFAMITRQAAPGLNQGVLRQFFRDRWISAEPHRLTQQARLVNPANLAKGIQVAGSSALEQT